ncbi:MAG: single-stranded-DNA-specific exonuclease RecJ [Polyangiaceae bacterium]|nr:single-stranded-DNA-specific exonuclease RecJ [Polyangiaceae bacterium]
MPPDPAPATSPLAGRAVLGRPGSSGPDPDGESVAVLARAMDLSVTVAGILVGRGISDPVAAARFLDPRLAHLTPPDGMAGRAEATVRLADAVRRRERVAVFGDYDCDGITATAILTEVLRRLDVEALPLLASRFDGGYGVTPTAAARIAASGATLLVTCDCGSSDHAVIAELGRRGLDVIVIDHHLVPDEPLPAVAFLNPHRPDCRFPYDGLASCGLALSVAAALRRELGVQIDLRELLDMVAIGTIADVAPLDGDNRVLVRAGLARLRHPSRPGLRALAELASLLGDTPVGAEDVAFRLAPRLNAPGRLGSAAPALELLLCADPTRAAALAAELEQRTIERRTQQDRIIAEASAEIERQGWRDHNALVLGRAGWNHGIVGIVAGRLAADLGCPVVVIGFDDAGVGRGSVRGPRGFPLFDAVSAVAPLLDRFGGHHAAAGLEVRYERLGELREAFTSICAGITAVPVPDAPAVPLQPSDDPARILRDLERLEPFGERNPAPRFRIRGTVVSAREVRGGHLKVELRLDDGRLVTGFGPGLGATAESRLGQVLVTGSLRWDRWRGGGAVEIGIERVEPCQG